MFSDNVMEFKFLTDSLKPNFKVLEYGSGESTLEISKLVNCIVSVEHNQQWAEKCLQNKPENCTLLYVPPCLSYIEYTENCGTYEEFKKYIESPNELGIIFDVVFIDGRARVHCAKNILKLIHEESIIFIHDYNRKQYHVVEDFLDMINIVGTMAMFRRKP